MSYLFSGVPGGEVPRLVQRAYDSLAPGGAYMVHDFMVENHRKGPPLAALWQLQHMAFTPDAHSVTAAEVKKEMEKAGFVDISVAETIPDLTKLVQARKPGVALIDVTQIVGFCSGAVNPTLARPYMIFRALDIAAKWPQVWFGGVENCVRAPIK